MIGRHGERGSGISVLAARHDDDDDDLCHVLYRPIQMGVKKRLTVKSLNLGLLKDTGIKTNSFK